MQGKKIKQQWNPNLWDITIPDEIWVAIFEYADKRELFNIMVSCKRFYNTLMTNYDHKTIFDQYTKDGFGLLKVIHLDESRLVKNGRTRVITYGIKFPPNISKLIRSEDPLNFDTSKKLLASIKIKDKYKKSYIPYLALHDFFRRKIETNIFSIKYEEKTKKFIIQVLSKKSSLLGKNPVFQKTITPKLFDVIRKLNLIDLELFLKKPELIPKKLRLLTISQVQFFGDEKDLDNIFAKMIKPFTEVKLMAQRIKEVIRPYSIPTTVLTSLAKTCYKLTLDDYVRSNLKLTCPNLTTLKITESTVKLIEKNIKINAPQLTTVWLLNPQQLEKITIVTTLRKKFKNMNTIVLSCFAFSFRDCAFKLIERCLENGIAVKFSKIRIYCNNDPFVDLKKFFDSIFNAFVKLEKKQKLKFYQRMPIMLSKDFYMLINHGKYERSLLLIEKFKRYIQLLIEKFKHHIQCIKYNDTTPASNQYSLFWNNPLFFNQNINDDDNNDATMTDNDGGDCKNEDGTSLADCETYSSQPQN